ncbi:MAG: monovalent cation/H(+) antiporter subunit G [Alphaproteobacteria bacterium]|uniref:Monovalent cation/H(+) antiporter subunit G n=1 Tax=Candidatus Nitrobium versatile TaxID=2884831 RepID=A0A953J476_9BACT|nr:monovalent cation/H(+) antiporter subunit G [Candidatus Nitrobium versatile]
MGLIDWISALLVLSGGIFFFAGTVGLLRFPDLYTRLHALTKADNLGLGLTVAGLLLQEGSVTAALQLFLVWILVLATSATACYLIASASLKSGLRPWRRP